ncbi:MAG: DNA mismatch repair endonuclease MutL [Ignavibacteria bacterium]|nr:DNA mismatch repair endonuclease MutL [Ignavibacteria bacterium]
MKKIKILPEYVASKIAAGEVVQRPESVVKELLENSIDAQASHITLIIKDAGKTLIQVIDDGIGMSEEDARLAFHRHSTSKISDIEDLERITTLGFRGEALYSIAAVSRVELKTKTEDMDLGTHIIIEGGKFLEQNKVNCERGTNITVKNLFFNVPARRNFLKSNATEFKHIYDTFQRLSLSHINIRFTFIDDDRLVIDLPQSSIEKRIQYYFGESFLESLIPVRFENQDLHIWGYIGAPHFAKKVKGQQFLFLNNRFVINKSVSHAVYRGYEHLIEKGEYPFYLIFINLDPKRIDVNVHPSKLEVKFDDENFIYSTIYSAVKEALTSKDFSPQIELKEADDFAVQTRFKNPIVEPYSFIAKEVYGEPKKELPTQETQINSSSMRVQKNNLFEIDFLENTNEVSISYTQENLDEATVTRQAWQLHNKYILTPIKNGLMIIDQHVAHERILYEKAIQSIENSLPFSQQLLFPQTIELSKPDLELILELKDYFEKIGFDIKTSGKSSITIYGIPQDVKQGKEKKVLLEILEMYREFALTNVTDEKDNIAKSFACKSAIKAGDPLTEKEMLSLIDNLFACKIPFVCPHGRPVFIKLTIDELDRRFGRTPIKD